MISAHGRSPACVAADTEAEKEAYYRDSNWPDQDVDPLAK
jgi:hypothetical protein